MVAVGAVGQCRCGRSRWAVGVVGGLVLSSLGLGFLSLEGEGGRAVWEGDGSRAVWEEEGRSLREFLKKWKKKRHNFANWDSNTRLSHEHNWKPAQLDH